MSREPTHDRRRQPEEAHSRCAIAQPRPHAASRQRVPRGHAGVRRSRLTERESLGNTHSRLRRRRRLSINQDVRRRPRQSRNPLRRDHITALGQRRRKFSVSQIFENSRNAEIFAALGAPSQGKKDAPRGPGRSLRSVAAEAAGALRGENFPCCKALRNQKTRKFFVVITERPAFRMSTGTRAVGDPLPRRLARRPCCVTPKPLKVEYACAAVPTEIAEPSSISKVEVFPSPGIAAREGLTAKRSGPEMAPQRFEKIESAPGNGMVWEASNPQDLVHGLAADRARLRLTSRQNEKVAKLQKKAPNALKSLDAELKSAPAFRERKTPR